MSKRNRSKVCPECEESFEAKRSNQLFCTIQCKTDYNNRKTMAKYHERNEEDVATRKINKILYRNWEILQNYIGQEVDLKQIEAQGFQNRYITYFQKKDNKMIFTCYDTHYTFLDEDRLKVSANKKYLL
jgi:hypothetical protein